MFKVCIFRMRMKFSIIWSPTKMCMAFLFEDPLALYFQRQFDVLIIVFTILATWITCIVL
jgi:hypothetical protein